MSNKSEHLYKLILVGDEKVGKSSIITRHVINTFSSTYIATTGTDFKAKTVDLSNIQEFDAPCISLKLEIWDTAGQGSLMSTFGRFFRNAQSVLICYDVCNRKSFENVSKYLQQVQMNAPVDAVVCIVGCKSDSYYSRKVSAAEGEQYASSKRCVFQEASAKNAESVNKLFQEVAVTILKQQLRGLSCEGGPPSCIDELSSGDADGDAQENKAEVREKKSKEEEKEEEQEEEHELAFRRSTLTAGAVGTGAHLLQSAQPLFISGAQSWYNSSKINGRYIPQLAKINQRDTAEVFCYWNADSENTIMLYSGNHWVVKRNRKELARLPAASIDFFPDEANRKSVWRENSGVYFTWMHLRPDIRCTVLAGSPASALPPPVRRQSVSFSGTAAAPMAALLGAASTTTAAAAATAGGGGGRSSFSFSERDRGSLCSYSEHGTSSSSARVYRGDMSGAGAALASLLNPTGPAAAGSGSSGGKGSGIFASILVLPFLQTSRCSGGGGGEEEGVIIINMDAFSRCCKDPERLLGLTPLLFCQYCQLRLAILNWEMKTAPNLLDAQTSVRIRAHCHGMQAALDQLVQSCNTIVSPEAATRLPAQVLASVHTQAPTPASAPVPQPVPQPVEASSEAIMIAGKLLLTALSRQAATLCAVNSGKFEQAGRCRDVRVEVASYLEEMRPGNRGSFSQSFSGRNSFSFTPRASFSAAPSGGGGW